MKKINVSLFVPHAGCPNRCSFCNQKSISGQAKKITAEDVRNAALTAMSTSECQDGEIAFFGGSFTAIERDYMLELLREAKKFVSQGCFRGIRISTRPDAVDDNICSILKQHFVTSVELGCQSMDDDVLISNRRGHTSKDVEKATLTLRKYGFEIGHQMMTGLYKSSYEKDIETARKIIALRPDTVRIYPTIVLENTELCRLYRTGEYNVYSAEKTIDLCAELLESFYKNNIKVIRTGLHSGGNVDDGYVAGFYHPAFKELCESRIYLNKILKQIKDKRIKKGNIVIFTAPFAVSPTIGHGRKNVEILKENGFFAKVFPLDALDKYEVKVEEER